jgi:hypothetical protein
METESQIIFQINDPIVLQEFDNLNYHIEFNNNEIKKNICVLYFSSNEIYYPNTLNAFNFSIVKQNRYEWKRNKFPGAYKNIFLRDIRKQWYIGGINSNLDTPQKLYTFLKSETKGFELITIGSSAGGFAAILFGSLLNASRIYAFNAQLNLNIIMKYSNQFVDPILFKNIANNDLNIYYDLSNIHNDFTGYYYFQSCKSKMDIEQFNGITEQFSSKINIIRFNTSNHGFPFLRINIPNILALPEIELKKISNRTYNLFKFSINLIGFGATFRFVFEALIGRAKKKIIEYYFSKDKRI